MTVEINKEDIFRLAKKLCETPSPSGFESKIREVLIEEIRDYVDELWIDSMGNLIAKKAGQGEGKVMIAAHMDEIGLMITNIDKNGFLRFVPVGGWSPRILPAQRVLIRTIDGNTVHGVIGIKPPHIEKPEERQKVIPLENLFIDIGVTSDEEAKKLGIEVGSIAVIESTVERLGNPDVITGRAFDDKIGVVTAVETLKVLEDSKVDAYFVFTVQEEVGLKGARTAAFSINPDIGIAIDVTIAADVPGTPEHAKIVKLGKGPAIKVMDGRAGSGLIAHPAIRDLLIAVAKEEKIPYQLEVLPGGTTDASAIQITREGIPAGAISIPTRYIHSPIEIVHLEDVTNAVKLLAKAIKKVDSAWINNVLRRRIK
ncbi:MAG: M42 family metallopeptidase [Candidatus Njordarchaeales archaeon]